MDFNNIADYFLFRFGGEEDNNSNKPIITLGAIIWGVLLRVFLIMFLTFIFINILDLYGQWYYVGGSIWFFALFPGYKQYQNFQQRIEVISKNTLCGTCKYYDKNSQLCKIYDEHVSLNHIPCGGDSWEPKSVDFDEE